MQSFCSLVHFLAFSIPRSSLITNDNPHRPCRVCAWPWSHPSEHRNRAAVGGCSSWDANMYTCTGRCVPVFFISVLSCMCIFKYEKDQSIGACIYVFVSLGVYIYIYVYTDVYEGEGTSVNVGAPEGLHCRTARIRLYYDSALCHVNFRGSGAVTHTLIICIHVCTYIYMYMYTYTRIHIYIYTYVCISIHTCI